MPVTGFAQKLRGLVARHGAVRQESDERPIDGEQLERVFDLARRAAERADLSALGRLVGKHGKEILLAPDSNGAFLAHTAAGSGQVSVLQYLADFQDPTNPRDRSVPHSLHAQDSDGLAPIHWAAAEGHISVLDEFVARRGVRILLCRDRQGGTLAHQAAAHGQLSILQRLAGSMDARVRGSLCAADEGGMTPAHLAGMRGNVAILRYLREHLPVEFSLCATDLHGATPAHWASLEGQIHVLEYLDAHPSQRVKGSLFGCDKHGTTPAHWACVKGRVSVLEYFNAHENRSVKESLFLRDALGNAPADWAEKLGQAAALRFLMWDARGGDRSPPTPPTSMMANANHMHPLERRLLSNRALNR